MGRVHQAEPRKFFEWRVIVQVVPLVFSFCIVSRSNLDFDQFASEELTRSRATEREDEKTLWTHDSEVTIQRDEDSMLN